MSAKWIQVKKWDDQNLTGWLLPVKWVLRALSAITMAVVLMLLLSLYGIAASVPVGLIAMAPSWLLFASVPAALIALSLWGGYKLAAVFTRGRGVDVRYPVTVLLCLGLLIVLLGGWSLLLWPYHPGSGQGLVFFPAFVSEHKAITIRRLPGMEMSELEFYSWWPFNTILYLFVVNMIVATVRRIAFTFENIGVLTVHTGIITLALGSAFYSVGKQEGDTLLLAGTPDEFGKPGLGKPVDFFYDNTRTAITVREPGKGEHQRIIPHLPRYNAYNLSALAAAVGNIPLESGTQGDDGRTVSIPLPSSTADRSREAAAPEIDLRIVGYAPYATLANFWRPVAKGQTRWTPAPEGLTSVPMRFLSVIQRSNAATGQIYKGEPDAKIIEKVRDEINLTPTLPASRISTQFDGNLAIEYTANLPEARWQELTAPLPDGALHAIIVELPASDGSTTKPVSRIYPAAIGKTISIEQPGVPQPWTIKVNELLPRPQFPIVSNGYKGAESSQIIVTVTPPPALTAQMAAQGVAGPFDRHIYSRFPELSQDFVAGETTPDNRPKRTAASPVIKLTYIDASILQIYFDEQPDPANPAGEPIVRSAMRSPASPTVATQTLRTGDSLVIGPPLAIKLGDRYDDAELVKAPVVTPDAERNKDNLGNHRSAAVAIEVSTSKGPSGETLATPFTRTLWLAHTMYLGFSEDDFIPVALPGGRTIELAFNRMRRPLPQMALQLTDFEMFPYPHSTQPRDYRSDLYVFRGPGLRAMLGEARFSGFERAAAKFLHSGSVERTAAFTSLNEPLLQSPDVWDPNARTAENVGSWLAATLGATRFKFAQSGWDSRGWTNSKARVEAGELKRPFANFTILGVGNNPGIYIIAGGAVLVICGIPWALWIKPALVQRKKAKIQQQLKDGTYVPPKKVRTVQISADSIQPALALIGASAPLSGTNALRSDVGAQA